MQSKKYRYGKSMSRRLKTLPKSIGKNFKGQKLYEIPAYISVQSDFPNLIFVELFKDPQTGEVKKLYVEK